MDLVTLFGIWFLGDSGSSALLLSPAEITIALLFTAILATVFLNRTAERELKETEEAIKHIKRPV